MKASIPFYRFCGILMLISEIWKQWMLTFATGDGTYIWWYFPFQLCSIPMYVCLAISLLAAAKNRTSRAGASRMDRISSGLAAFLMDYGMLGGIFAFFDTSGMHYAMLPLTIHSFAWHILLIMIGCYSGLSRDTDHSAKGYLAATLLYLVCCVLATVFNLAFYQYGTINMFYISPHYYMRQKVFWHITDAFGNYCGIAAYIAASVFGAGLIHLIWNRIVEIRKIQEYNRQKE